MPGCRTRGYRREIPLSAAEMKTPGCRSLICAFTLRELVISMALVGTLVFLAMAAIPQSGTGLVNGRLTHVLSNMKQLHLATQQMTLDSQTANTPPNIRWTCTNGRPLKFPEWTNLLVSNGYLTEKDLAKLLKSPLSGWSTNIFTVYAVGDFDPPETLLLATDNWKGLTATSLAKSPLSDSGFVVFHKGGDGAILRPRQLNLTNIIGTGGKFNYLPLP